MAKPRNNYAAKKCNGGIVKLKTAVERLQKTLLSTKKSSSYADEYEETYDLNYVPEDVKEGCFAVIAKEYDELKRFVVPLRYLANPSFLRLLEQAADEYGFRIQGAVTVPCRPSELERILAEQHQEGSGSRAAAGGGTCVGDWAGSMQQEDDA